MLGPFEWFQTVRVVWNLAKFFPELLDARAPLQSVPAELEPFSVPGPFAVERLNAYGVDEAERATPLQSGRHAHFSVTYPVGISNCRAVLFSGGGGDDGTGYESIARHWASHGIVVFQPVHADSFTHHFHETNSKFWAHFQTTADVWGLVLGEAHLWRARIRDLTDLLDEMGDFGGRVDTNRIGAGGYSYGGHAACVLGGAHLWARGGRFDLSDNRIKAVASISGESGARRAPKGIWKTLKVPSLFVTGDRDKSVWERSPHPKIEAYRHTPSGRKHFVDIRGASHFAFSGRLLESAKHPADVAAQTAIFQIVLGATTKFWLDEL